LTDHPSTIGLVLDCADPAALAELWAAALGYTIIGEAGNHVALVPNGRPGPKLLLQRVTEPKRVKNRMHIDIETPDIRSEAARLEAHGAARVQPDSRSEHGSTWILMADPEGNEFCVCDAGTGSGHRP
jgi:predicted enzyme related to lactoylglutathione lyase